MNHLLGTLLGDAYIKTKKNSASFLIEHSTKQLDYLTQKANLIQQVLGGTKLIYSRKDRNISVFEKQNKTFVNWKLKYYPLNKKSLVNILSDVTDFNTAIAFWFMDDGCISHANRKKGTSSPRLRLAVCNENAQTLEFIINWFKNYGYTPKILIQNNYKRQKSWPLLSFNVLDSKHIWFKIKPFIKTKSMKHKFRIFYKEYNTSTSVRLPNFGR